MKHIFIYCSITVLILVSTSFTSSAQRTSKGTVHIGVSQMATAYSIPSGGLDISAGQYLLNAFWKAGLMAADYNQKVTSAGSDAATVFDHTHLAAYGDWMWRLAGSYSRSVSLYAGGGVFLGCNAYELFRDLPDELAAGFPSCEFIYGVKPSVELECFITRRTALVLGIQSPLTFSSSLPTDLWHLTGSLGIRINLK